MNEPWVRAGKRIVPIMKSGQQVTAHLTSALTVATVELETIKQSAEMKGLLEPQPVQARIHEGHTRGHRPARFQMP